MLNDKLQGADEKQQLLLLSKAGPELTRMISDANTDPSAARDLAEAVSHTKGAAKQQLLTLMANGTKGADSVLMRAKPTSCADFRDGRKSPKS